MSKCWRQSLKEILIIRFERNGKIGVFRENYDFSKYFSFKWFLRKKNSALNFFELRRERNKCQNSV